MHDKRSTPYSVARRARRHLLALSMAVFTVLMLLSGRPLWAASGVPERYQASPDTGGATVAVGENADLGSILVGPAGMTLYMFDRDVPGTSNCYDDCAVRWPPLLVAEGEQPVAGEGVTAELGVTERTDGTYQVTAGGWPLYYWWEDTAPGEAFGQAVGDVWWVMAPDGNIIRTAAAAEAAPAATEAAAEEAPAEATPAATEAAMEEAPAEATPAATEAAVEEAPAEATPAATEEAMEEAPAEATPAATEAAVEEAPAEAAAAPTEAAMEEAPAEEAAAPDRLPTTGGDGGLLALAVAALTLLAGGGWVALRRAKS